MTPATGDNRLLNEVLSRLKDIGLRINQLNLGEPAALDAVLHLIVESAITIVPGATAIIYTYDAGRQALDPISRVAAGAHITQLTEDQPRPAGLGARAIELRRPVLSYAEPQLIIHPAKRAAGAQVVACLPLIVADRPLGVLYVYLRETRHLTELELLLLANLVNQAATAIHHAGEFSTVRRDLARKEDELALLRHAGLLITSRTRLEDTLEAILQMALEVTGARYGIFRLVDPSGKNLVTRAIAGDRLGQPAVEALPINTTSIMGWVAVTRQPLNIADVRQPPWDRVYYPLDHALQMRADLAVPLIGAGGRLEGVLNLESPQVAAFSEADSHLLQALVVQAVIAIQEVRLLDGLREIAERLLTQELGPVLAHLTELACDLINARTAGVWTVERGQPVLRAASADHPPVAVAAPDQEWVQRALATGAAFTYQRHIAAQPDPPESWTHALVMPVLSPADRRPIGAFVVRQVSAEQDPALHLSVLAPLRETNTGILSADAHAEVAATAPSGENVAKHPEWRAAARSRRMRNGLQPRPHPSTALRTASGRPLAVLRSAQDASKVIFKADTHAEVGATTDEKVKSGRSGRSASPIFSAEQHGPSEWDYKVLAILAHYAALALENATRQQALAEAQEARAVAETFAAMGDIAANLLHHLNNKVGAIPVRVEGIQDKCAPALAANPYLAANLAEIEHAALDAMAAVRERLSLLRPIERAPVAIADCVADALAAIRLPAGMAIVKNGLDRLPPVMAGRESLALVIGNLLDNAIEALGQEGEIIIAGGARDQDVELTVRDNGPGIAPSLQGRIFEFDFSSQRRTVAGKAGTVRAKLGFGLWWVKTLMTRLGGAIIVESDGRHGTTFRLRLPRASTEMVP